MATTFNMLRANDLIWSFVINNYLLGKQPMPFDLLYWNSDTTRMPETMHLFYLRECYKDNALAQGKMVLGGVKLDLSKVKMPVYLQSREGRPHRAVPLGLQVDASCSAGPIRFIIAGSRPHRRRDQPAGREEVPVLDQRQRRRRQGKPIPRQSRTGRPARPSIPAPGGRTGTSGCRSSPARKSPPASPATASSRCWATRPGPT